MRSPAIACLVLLALLVSCGTDTQTLNSSPVTNVTVTSTGERVRPVGGQAVGSGHVVLYGIYGEASDSSGDLRRSRKVVDVDIRTGTIRWLEIPSNFAIAEAVATPAGLIALGGVCGEQDVISVSAADDLWCPERISESYLMDWKSGTWQPLKLPSTTTGRAPYPYLEGGGLVSFDNRAYASLRISSEEVAIFLLAGNDTWTHLTNVPPGGFAPCAIPSGLVIHEQYRADDDLDQVMKQQVRLVRQTGESTLIDFPATVANDSYGGIAAKVGCLSDGPVVIYGGPDPTAKIPVNIITYDDQAWIDVTLASPDETAGGLPSHIETNDGWITFGLATPSKDGSIRRDAYLVVSASSGAVRIGSINSADELSMEADPRFFYDKLTGNVVEVIVNHDRTQVSWNAA